MLYVGPASMQHVDPASMLYVGPASMLYLDPASMLYVGPASMLYVDPAFMQYGGPASMQYVALHPSCMVALHLCHLVYQDIHDWPSKHGTSGLPFEGAPSDPTPCSLALLAPYSTPTDLDCTSHPARPCHL
jgi:hypothetical protein